MLPKLRYILIKDFCVIKERMSLFKSFWRLPVYVIKYKLLVVKLKGITSDAFNSMVLVLHIYFYIIWCRCITHNYLKEKYFGHNIKLKNKSLLSRSLKNSGSKKNWSRPDTFFYTSPHGLPCGNV